MGGEGVVAKKKMLQSLASAFCLTMRASLSL